MNRHIAVFMTVWRLTGLSFGVSLCFSHSSSELSAIFRSPRWPTVVGHRGFLSGHSLCDLTPPARASISSNSNSNSNKNQEPRTKNHQPANQLIKSNQSKSPISPISPNNPNNANNPNEQASRISQVFCCVFESHSWGTPWMPVTAGAGRRWIDASKDSERWLDMSDGHCSNPRSWTTEAPEPQVSCSRWWSSLGAPAAHTLDDGATDSTTELERERLGQERREAEW